MNKSEIQQRLQENHHRFIKQIMELPEADFLKPTNGKWTAGQQLDHLVKAVSPVNLAFLLPGFLLKAIFGKANRASRSYNELVEKYKSKLAAGGKASAPFIPKPVEAGDREKLSKRLHALTASMVHQINSFSEEQLDTFILPHPLLGKLTFREMLYFTIYHSEHHEKQVLKNLENQQV
ncbi:MAG: DinB family protein [Cyclobacteriaceae bacterium]